MTMPDYSAAEASKPCNTQQKPKQKQVDKQKARQPAPKKKIVSKEKGVGDNTMVASEEPLGFSGGPIINLEEIPCNGGASNPAIGEVPTDKLSKTGDASGNLAYESPRQTQNVVDSAVELHADRHVSFADGPSQLPFVAASSSHSKLGPSPDLESLFSDIAEIGHAASAPRRRDLCFALTTLASPNYRDIADLGQPARLPTADEHISLALLDANRQIGLIVEARRYARERSELLKVVQASEKRDALLQKGIDEVKN